MAPFVCVHVPQVAQVESDLLGMALIGKGGGGLVFSAMWQGAQVAVKFMLSEWHAPGTRG